MAKFPSRWNREGQRAVYTATSQALALAETIVHLPRGLQPKGYSMLTITLQPEELILRRSLQSAKRWFEQFGFALAERPDDPVALIAPSVIVPEYNVVLYPRPENFEPNLVKIDSVQPFEFDLRMFDQFAASLVN